jgi:peptidase A4-like protein
MTTQEPGPRYRIDEVAPGIGHTVPPGVHVSLAVPAVPDAVCWVHPDGDDDPAHRLRVYADSVGVARFGVQADRGADEPVGLVVDALAEDRVTRHPVRLRFSHDADESMPPPAADVPRAGRGARQRPGLSLEQAPALTPQRALDEGYPLPPDADAAPAAYERWLRLVGAPSVLVEPRVVASPDVSAGKAVEAEAGPKSFTNWSGYELLRMLLIVWGGRGPISFRFTDPYDWVTGTWRVPAVTGQLGLTTYSNMWVGLDGDGVPDLVQAGTEQDNVTFPQPNAGRLSLSSYYAWTEFLPQQGTEQVITSLAVRPGDEVFTEVWMGDAAGDLSLSGSFGRFVIINLTTGQSVLINTPRGSTIVPGREAVWIVERPTVGGALPFLANYGSATMYYPSARRINSARHQGYVNYLTGSTQVDTMTDSTGTRILSTVTAIDSQSMRFDWQAFA